MFKLTEFHNYPNIATSLREVTSFFLHSSELMLALSAHTDPHSSLETLSQGIKKKTPNSGANREQNCLHSAEASMFCQNDSSLPAITPPLPGLIRQKSAFSFPI